MEFTERNIAEDEGAFDELERLGTMTTPVTVVGGDEVIVGFDRERLSRALGL